MSATQLFLVFTIALIPYYLARTATLQVAILAGASIAFYAYFSPAMTGLLILSMVSAAVASWLLNEQKPFAQPLAVATILFQLCILAFFKYKFLFVEPSIAPTVKPPSLGDLLLWAPLPIGISFYTFHAISIIVDTMRNPSPVPFVRRGLAQHLLRTALYITFFAQVVAGPIVRAKTFMPQIKLKSLEDCQVRTAVEFLAIGYFLKVFVADNLSGYTFVLGLPGAWPHTSSYSLAMAIFGYSIQIFADFAGYSYIALGIAKLFGYDLVRNFNLPYIASSFSDFWRRWHISLSTWLRDYLYVPLGGNRHGRVRTYLNLIIVMLLGGLWHGAQWKFLFWGGLHGCALVAERILADQLRLVTPMATISRFASILSLPLTFAVVTFGWLFFAVPHLSDIPLLFRKLVDSPWIFDSNAYASTSGVVMFSLPVVLMHLFKFEPAGERLQGMQTPAPIVGLMILSSLLFNGPPNAFIYFQF